MAQGDLRSHSYIFFIRCDSTDHGMPLFHMLQKQKSEFAYSLLGISRIEHLRSQSRRCEQCGAIPFAQAKSQSPWQTGPVRLRVSERTLQKLRPDLCGHPVMGLSTSLSRRPRSPEQNRFHMRALDSACTQCGPETRSLLEPP